MSQSPLHHPSTGEAGYPFTTLNAEAMSFSPFSPLRPSVSPRSALRPLAPSFIASVASTATPQSLDEHVTETFGAPPFEPSWVNEAGDADPAGGSPGTIDYGITTFNFDTNGLEDFIQFDQALGHWDQLQDLQGISGDLPMQYSQTTQDSVPSFLIEHPQVTHNTATGVSTEAPQIAHDTAQIVQDTVPGFPTEALQITHDPALGFPIDQSQITHDRSSSFSTEAPQVTQDTASSFSMRHPQVTHDHILSFPTEDAQVTHDTALSFPMEHQQNIHDTALSSPTDHAETTQWTGEAYVMGERSVLSTIENEFDFGLAATTGASHDDSSAHPATPSLSFGGNYSGEDEDAIFKNSEDVDGEYETDDEYQYLTPDSYVDYPTPESERDTLQQTSANAVGAVYSVNSNTTRNRKAGNTGITSTKRTNRSTSSVQGSGVNKSQRKGPAKAKVLDNAEEANDHRFNSDLTERLRKANGVISKQRKKANLAQRLGQYMRVVRTGSRVSIQGVYWKAPENDATIPSTETDKLICADQLVAAIRNNQDCKEVPNTQVFRNRWANGASHFATEEILDAAWDIVVSHLSSPSR
jgi:hypothetical protein